MGTLKQTDVGALVAEMNATLQPDGRCSKADKRTMGKILKHLRDYTAEVQLVADEEGITDDTNVAQWALDMAHWRERLAGYEAAVDADPLVTGQASCEWIYPTVVGPVLDGRYDKATNTAGIVNPAVASPPDISTPYSLGNQVLVYREFQAERFSAFMRYFLEEAKKLPAKARRLVRSAAPSLLKLGAGLALAAVGATVILDGIKTKTRSGT